MPTDWVNEVPSKKKEIIIWEKTLFVLIDHLKWVNFAMGLP